MINKNKLENLIYEVSRAWGLNDRDLTFEYELWNEWDEINILLKIFIPVNEEFKWIDFWCDVGKHISKIYDIIVFVEHKRSTE